jgi:hypothetical protein
VSFLIRSAINSVRKPSDQYWSSVVLLVGNDNAANGSTTFTDQATGKSATNAGSATVAYTNTSAPTGLTTSINFDGSSYLTWADHADFEPGSGAWTVEAFVRRTANTTQEYLTKSNGTANAWGIYLVAGGVSSFYAVYDAVGDQTVGTMVNNTWHHIAYCRSGNTHYTYLDGVQGATWSDSAAVSDTASVFSIGARADGNSKLTGQMAAIRFTKGAARYTAAFSVPTLPYPTA